MPLLVIPILVVLAVVALIPISIVQRYRLGIGCKKRGQDFDRNRSLEPRVAGPLDLAHAAGADRFDDLKRADARPGRERHWLSEYIDRGFGDQRSGRRGRPTCRIAS